jgi:hypothetical protein
MEVAIPANPRALTGAGGFANIGEAGNQNQLPWNDRVNKPPLPELPPMPIFKFQINPPEITFTSGMFLGINMAMIFMAITCITLGLYILWDPLALAVITRLSEKNLAGLIGFSTRVLTQAAVTFIIFGLITGCTAIFGVAGCLQSHIRCLNWYAYATAVYVTIETVISIVVCVYYSIVLEYIFEDVLELLKDNYDGKTDKHSTQQLFTLMMDAYQEFMHCCGVNNYTDYNSTTFVDIVNRFEDRYRELDSDSTELDMMPTSIKYKLESEFHITCRDQKLMKINYRFTFPTSCCCIDKRTQNINNPDCMCLKPSLSNENTYAGCLTVTKQVLRDQVW